MAAKKVLSQLDFDGNRIISVGPPQQNADAATKGYVDTLNGALESRIDALEGQMQPDFGDGLEEVSGGSGAASVISVLPQFASQLQVSPSGLAFSTALWTWLTTKRSHAETIGDGTATDITVTHGLGTRDVVVQVYGADGTYADYFTSVERDSTNSVVIGFTNPPATNAYRVLVQAVGYAPPAA